MSGLSFNDRRQIWIQAGGDPSKADTAAAISMAENNSGDPARVGTIAPGEYSVGLWQINIGEGVQGRITQYGWTPQYLSDPYNNAKAAIQISGNGSHWDDWTTYTGGEYKAYLNGAGDSATSNPGSGGSNTIPFEQGEGCQTFAWKFDVFGSKNTICFDPMIGAFAMLGGGLLMLSGVAVLVAFALRETGAGRAASQAVGFMPGPVGAVASAQRAREQRREQAASDAEAARRDAVDRSHREAMQRSQLRVSRARARVAESRARESSAKRPTVVKTEEAA